MKKLLFIVGMLFPTLGFAGDLITTTLLDNVQTVTQFKSGETSLALMDSIVLIGHKNNRSIFDLQLGFAGDVKPDPDQVSGASLLAGGFFNLSALLHDSIHFSDQWKFLNSLQYGASWLYDFRDKRDFACLQVGLAFSLNPKQ